MVKFGFFLTKSIYLNKIHHYWKVSTTLHVFITTLGRQFNFFKEKVKGSDRDVSTVALQVFFSQTFPIISLTADSYNFGIIEKLTPACHF